MTPAFHLAMINWEAVKKEAAARESARVIPRAVFKPSLVPNPALDEIVAKAKSKND